MKSSHAAVLVCCLLASACARKTPPEDASAYPAAVKVEEAPDASHIAVEHPEEFPLVAVTSRAMPDELSANGVVNPDVSRSVPVLSLAGGRVVDIRARLGDTVKKGQILLKIDSNDVSVAFADYQKFVAGELLARKQLDRAKTLYDKGAVALKDLETAEDTENRAKVDVAAAAERVRLLGGDPTHPSPIVDVVAPISGTIVEQNVTAGTGVRSIDNSPNLFTIADLSRVWLLCDVFENNLSQVHVGDAAAVRLNAYPDRAYHGRVGNIGPVLDPITRAAKVRLEIANPDGAMRVGMFAAATFRSRAQQARLFIPATAVLRLHDRDWVFIPAGGKRFRRVAIEGGPTGSDGMQEVSSGLSSGDRVAGNALQLSGAANEE